MSATEAAERVGCPEDHALALEIARAAVTVVKDEQGAIPLEPKQSGKVLVVTPQLSDLTQAEERGTSLSTLGEVVRRRIPDAQEIVIGTSPSVSQRSQVVLAARDADTIIIGTYRANQNQALLVNDLRRMGKRLIVVALREPYDLLLFPDVPTYVATYGYLPVHMEALGEVLFGDAPARGRLPVSLPGLTTEGSDTMRGHGSRAVVLLVAVALGVGFAAAPLPTAAAKVQPGIEVLLDEYLHLIEGKRVGLITNHTGIDSNGTHIADLLNVAPGVTVAAFFAPASTDCGGTGRPENASPRTSIPIRACRSIRYTATR